MRIFRVGVIGYGMGARVFHAPLISATPGLELAAIVSGRRDEIASRYPGVPVLDDAEAVFADPSIDLVVVVTPNASHFDLASRALKAGKHVVIDKPFACTAGEAQELIARSRGRLLSVFHNRRWDGDFLTLKKLIATGTLGQIAQVESRFDLYRPVVQDRWRERPGPASGAWYDLGSHLVDQALQAFGRPLALYADLAARRPGAVTTDYFRVLLRYPMLRVVLAGDLQTPTGLRFSVHGAAGSWIKHGLDPQQAALSAGVKPDVPGFGRETSPSRLVGPDGGERALDVESGDYRAYYRSIALALAGIRPVPVTARQALLVMDLLQAGEESAARGREIVFDS